MTPAIAPESRASSGVRIKNAASDRACQESQVIEAPTHPASREGRRHGHRFLRCTGLHKASGPTAATAPPTRATGRCGRRAPATGGTEALIVVPRSPTLPFSHHDVRGPITVQVAAGKWQGMKTISSCPVPPEDPVLPGVEQRPPQDAAVAARTGESRPTFHRIDRPDPGRLEVVAHDVGHAVAVQVSGRLQPVESAPRLGRLGAKRAELAVNRTPEVGQTVAVQVGGLGPGKPGDRVRFVARRGRQEMDDRRIGSDSKPIRRGDPGRQVAADRDRQHRPAVRPSAPPEHRPDGSRVRS